MFIHKCPLRRETPPLLPCDCSECDWYIRNSGHNNCFWVLSYYLEQTEERLTREEVAALEGITVEEVLRIEEQALSKCGKEVRALLNKEDNSIDVS